MTKLSYDELAEHFAIHGFKWKIGEELKVPNAEEIERVVEASIEKLREEADFSTLSIGRLRIEKTGEEYGVYTYFGDAS